MDNFRYKGQLLIKRLIDMVVSLTGLFLLSPGFVIIALAIKVDSKGPVFYVHKRIGKDGKPFKMYKFRSMTTDASDAKYMEYLRLLIESERENPDKAMPYRKLENDPRITRVGRFLRRFYFDELPQLFNILKGEMSLVGPRPHVQYEVDNYTEEQRRRMTVKPGVTGLWQASGKVNSSFNELIAMDLEYIDGWSLSLDFQIVLTTISVILKGGEQIWGNMTNSIPGFRKRHAVPLNGSSVLVEKKEEIGRQK
jgi:lipopolysaccharide/colanic/teichoic acid biosynthesis glycosyltransferase